MAITLLRKLNELLNAHLDGFRSGLSQGARSDRITGFVVSERFSRREHSQRQRDLWKIIERELTPAEQARVGPIVTMSPAEADIGESAA